MSGSSQNWGWRLFVWSTLLGALGGLTLIPHAWSTAAAQVCVALGHPPEWMRAAYTGAFDLPSGLTPGEERALTAAPNDAVLHLGAAALERYGESSESAVQARLDALADRFPSDASIRASQLRQMMLTPVWIPRAEVPPPAPRPVPPGVPFGAAMAAPGGAGTMPPLPKRPERPSLQALQRFEAAARAGQRTEPANGFFDAMQAVAAFAGDHDEEALHDLHTAAAKPAWNDHASDQVRAQWKLLRTVFGDRGALQIFPAPNELLVPHFAPLRNVARLAVRLADEHQRAGDHVRARRIRGDVMRLGLRLQDQSPSVIGKQVGQAIFYIGMAPGTRAPAARQSESRERWRRRLLGRYVAYLETHGGAAEAEWVRYESDRVEALYGRIHCAFDLPGYRALRWGAELTAWWEFGLVVVEQIMLLLALWGGLALLGQFVAREKAGAVPLCDRVWLKIGPLPVGPWTAAYLALFTTPIAMSMVAFGPTLDVWTDLWPYILGTGLVLTGLLALARWVGKRRQRRAEPVSLSPGERRARWEAVIIGLASGALPLALVAPSCILTSHMGDVSWLLEHHSALGHSGFAPELALLPLVLIGFLTLCCAAVLGLPVVVGLCRGVRQAAPYAVALLTLLYIAAAGPTSRADRATTHQIEWELSDELSAMEEPQAG